MFLMPADKHKLHGNHSFQPLLMGEGGEWLLLFSWPTFRRPMGVDVHETELMGWKGFSSSFFLLLMSIFLCR